jgi:16S rRNA G966 N2-methylase RsmD
VDYFTFHERLCTVGNKGISFIEFLDLYDTVYADKPYLQRHLEYYREIGCKNSIEWQLYKTYQMYFSSINAFKPTVAMQVYHRYKPYCVLDFTAGWGGRMVGACAYGVPRYVGIDTNVNLLQGYGEMIELLGNMTNTQMDIHFWDAATFDYSRYKYDMVFTSPPYYKLEVYSHQPKYNTKREMSIWFYGRVIRETWAHLSPGGSYVINTNQLIYEKEFVPILGECTECFTMSMDVRNIEKKYTEMIYMWRKPSVVATTCVTV